LSDIFISGYLFSCQGSGHIDKVILIMYWGSWEFVGVWWFFCLRWTDMSWC